MKEKKDNERMERGRSRVVGRGKRLKVKRANLSTKQKQTHRPRGQTCGCQGGGGREREELGVWGW